MSEYTIRYAAEEDIAAIRAFIDRSWKRNHIFVRDERLFKWQYTSDKLDYVIGIDENGDIQGMLGFISYSDDDRRDIATSMWKANPGTGFLGIKLLMYIQENEKHRTLFSPGINVETSGGIYRRMGIATGRMNQWYRLNRVDAYRIAGVKTPFIPGYSAAQSRDIVKYDTFDAFAGDFNHGRHVSRDTVPYKSLEYIRRRYFKHPSYRYSVYGIKDRAETKAVIVIRIQEHQGSRALRLIDCIGDYAMIGAAAEFLDGLMRDAGAEYIDMYEKGLSEEMLINGGWTNLSGTDNIIPNYFSPYEQRNVVVNYCTTDENIVLFRGDGDQDRPN